MTVRFAVRVVTPVYHHSTDGFMGEKITTWGIFPSIEEAVTFASLENAEAYACGNTPAFFVAHRRNGQWVSTDLDVHAPDTTPQELSWF